jgi:hypothetical protein
LSSILFGSYYFFTFRLRICGQVLAAQNQLTQLPGRRAPAMSGHSLDSGSQKPEKYFQEIGNGLSLLYENSSKGLQQGNSASGPHPDSSSEDLECPQGIWRYGPDHCHRGDPPTPAQLLRLVKE